ncbi:MAG: outer membrane beta-barrel protein [Gammaproteobacteria bacterium]|nr:outer membrane beta-barrel protein [Gammaproteobacteria bacterium]
MRTNILLTGLGALGAVGLTQQPAAAADDVNYTYLQLHAVGRDVDAFDDQDGAIEDLDDGSGFGIRGSYQFLPKYFVFGDYSDTDSDVAFASESVFPLPADTDITRMDVGVGTNLPINDRVDFVGRVAYTDVDYGDFDIGAGGDLLNGGLDNLRDQLREDDSDGYFADAGVRAQLTENLEGAVGLRYTDVQNIDTTTVIGSLMFELSDSWGIDLSVDAGDELSTYLLGVRFSPEI